MVNVCVKVLGLRKPVIKNHPVQIPDKFFTMGKQLTLKDLLTFVVKEEVREFKLRQEENKLIRVLTEREIKEGEKVGKIDSGGKDHEFEQIIDDDRAVETALVAFDDGLYYVFIDKRQIKNPDEQIQLNENSEITFLRLVALAGG